MRKLLIYFAVLSVISLMVACNGRRPSTENTETNNNDVVVLSETEDAMVEGDEDVVRDTIDLDTYLGYMEGYMAIIKDIHINSIADTVLLSDEKMKESMKPFEKILEDPVLDREIEDLMHSERVRVYQMLLSLTSEMYRINEEMKKVGVPLQSRMLNEREEKIAVENIENLKKELDKELN